MAFEFPEFWGEGVAKGEMLAGDAFRLAADCLSAQLGKVVQCGEVLLVYLEGNGICRYPVL